MPDVVEPNGPPGVASGACFTFILLASWVVMALNLARDAFAVPIGSALAAAWIAAAWLAWSLLFVLVLVAPVAAAQRLLASRHVAPILGRWRRPLSLALLAGLALALATAQVFVFVDAQVFSVFGFHVNGFVWNLLGAEGGLESMGAGPSTIAAFGGLVVVALVLQAGIVVRAARRGPCSGRLAAAWRRVRLPLAAGLFALLAFERVTLGLADAANVRPVLAAAGAFPLVPPVRMHSFAASIGLDDDGGGDPQVLATGALRLKYPLAPVVRDPAAPRPNIVWLVAESWRADMLDPAIMPATCAFAAESLDFRQHYSGGNGTRMGIFSMFYGLYGSYWFPFLAENRAPVLMDVLREGGWDIEAYTSARFTFPELDETVFAGVPPSRLHEGDPDLPGWQNDRVQVTRLLESIDRHGPDEPFFEFMFFESAHARYSFPEESVIARPYLQEVNYAALDLERDIGLIRNRYVNACHHLDSQLARVLDHLRERGLLQSTLVVLTGDHGEEFLEHGRWGHHSDFSDEQTRTPLVLHVPGEAPRRVTTLSSHLDLPATLLARLGVRAPPSDHGFGRDLLGAGERRDCVVADWDHLALVTDRFKAAFPTSASLERLRLTTRDDQPLDDEGPFWAGQRGRVQEMLEELSRFSR